MNSTVSTSAASAGASGAFVVVAAWLLGLVHVQIPADVAAALIVLLTTAVHYAVALIGKPKAEAPKADAATPAQ